MEITKLDQREQVLQAISKILADKAHHSTSLNYAIAYCKAAMNMTADALKVQCLYILNNITHWRHPDAKDVRAVLKTTVNNN